MEWIYTIIPAVLILWHHFHGQTSESALKLASNYWIIFYIICYFLPISLFVSGTDGWSIMWGYPFKDFEDSLLKAVLLATIGGFVISACSRGYGRIRLSPPMVDCVNITTSRQNVGVASGGRALLVFVTSLGSLFVGVYLVGGLWVLLENLGDRITLFAGLNALFLPVNMLIGVCFAISASRVLKQATPFWMEILVIALTLPSLFLLGQKSNIFILIIGVIAIKSSNFIRVNWALLLVGGFVIVNLLLVYEFLFREALIVGVDADRLTLDGWTTYAWTQITGNFMQIQNLTVLVDAMPDQLSYKLGETYLAIFSLVIPQQLIGVKPLTAAGVHTLAFWPEIVLRESTTMPPGIFGEAYINYGFVGFVGFCVIIGILLRYVDKSWRKRKEPTIFSLVLVATASSLALHFIRGELFSPLLIVLGIILGARATVVYK